MPPSFFLEIPILNLLLNISLFALGLVPFINPARMAPDASFWGQMGAGWIFAIWMLLSAISRLRAPSKRSSGALATIFIACCLSLALIIALQLSLNNPLFPVAAGLTAATILYAAAVSNEASQQNLTEHSLACFAHGISASLLINGTYAIANRAGFETVWLKIVPSQPQYRIIGSIGQTNHLASLCAIALAASVFLQRNCERPRYYPLLICGCAGFMSAFTHSRTGIITAAAVSAISLLSQSRSCRFKISNPTAQCIGIFWLFLLTPSVLPVTAPVDKAAYETARHISAAVRIQHSLDAIAIGLKHPWLGANSGEFAAHRLTELNSPFREPNATHAHNLYTHLFAEYGIFGLLTAIIGSLAGTSLFFRGLKGSRIENQQHKFIFLWSIIITIIIHSQFEYPLWFLYFLLPFSWAIGQVSTIPSKPINPDKGHRSSPSISIAAAILSCCGLVILQKDFSRIQNIAQQLNANARANINSRPSLQSAMRIASLTAFPQYGFLLATRSFDHSSLMIQDKLDIARLSAYALPSEESISQYIIFLKAANRPDEANQILESISHRNPDLYASVVEAVRLGSDTK